MERAKYEAWACSHMAGKSVTVSPTAPGGAHREDEPSVTATASQREEIKITQRSPREQSVQLGHTVTCQAMNLLYILLLRILLFSPTN